MVIEFYHYIFKELDIGYEVFNKRNYKKYFINYTDKNGWECTCAGKIIGNTRLCKHIRHVKKVFGLTD